MWDKGISFISYSIRLSFLHSTIVHFNQTTYNGNIDVAPLWCLPESNLSKEATQSDTSRPQCWEYCAGSLIPAGNSLLTTWTRRSPFPPFCVTCQQQL